MKNKNWFRRYLRFGFFSNFWDAIWGGTRHRVSQRSKRTTHLVSSKSQKLGMLNYAPNADIKIEKNVSLEQLLSTKDEISARLSVEFNLKDSDLAEKTSLISSFCTEKKNPKVWA